MNKTVIKIMAALAIVTTLFSGFPVQAANYQRVAAVERKIKREYKHIRILEGDNSPEFWRKIENRRGNAFYYVEKVTGTVKNAETGDGEATCGYINYKRVKGAKTGSKVMTWFVYSRDNNDFDGIIERYDIIINKIN
jgi:hypothetical protein